MSANNYLLIKQYSQKPLYRVSDQCIECPPLDGYFGSSDSLRGAVEIANQYKREEEVEYGISIDLLEGAV